MTVLSPGAICTVRQFGPRLFVAQRPEADHRGEPTRYRLICKRIDSRGRSDYQAHVAGIHDVVVIHPAETYAVSSTVTFEKVDYLVLEDKGDSIEVGVPEHGAPLKRGGVLRIPSGNTRVLDKAALILDGLS